MREREEYQAISQKMPFQRRSGWRITRELIHLIRPLLSILLLAIMLGVLGHLMAIFLSILAGFILLDILHQSMISWSAGALTGIMIAFAVLRGFLHYGEQGCNHYVAFKLLALIRHNVFSQLRRLSPAKMDDKNQGNLLTLLTNDIELLEVFYAHTISPIAIAVLTSGFMILFIGSYHPLFGLIALISYVLVGILIPLIASRFGREESMELRNELGRLSTEVLENLNGLPEILQFGQEEKRLEQLNGHSRMLQKRHEYLQNIEGKRSAVMAFTILFSSLAMLLTASWLYLHGQLAFGAVLIPVIGLMSSFGPVAALSNLSGSLVHTFAAGERVLSLLEEDPVTEDVVQQSDIAYQGVGTDKLSFQYDEKSKALEEFSFTANPGELIGIQGKSGSGKSTLLKLLMHFYSVDQGTVFFQDGITRHSLDIEKVNTASLRSFEGYVEQETFLFEDTIAANIALGRPEATESEIRRAAKKAALTDFIAALPDGYETKVDQVMDQLSGGECQRIGIARAFLNGADLLLLDEPTSNLDSLNEAIVLKALEQEKMHRTILLVSHRDSTLGIADRVLRITPAAESRQCLS